MSDPQALEPILLADETGREVVNPSRESETAMWLRAVDWPLAPAAGAALGTQFVAPKKKDGGDIEIRALAARSNHPFLCQFREPPGRGGWQLSNQPVHHNNMFGKGGRPFKLARSIYVPSGSFFEANVTSKAASLAGDVRLLALGRWMRPEMKKESRDAISDALKARRSRCYWLTDDGTSTALTANQNGKDIFMTMPAGLRLVSWYVLAESTGPFEVDIYEYESGLRLTQGGFVDIRLIAGNGQVPAECPGLLLIEPVQRVNIKANDLSGVANTVYLTFHGIAVETAMPNDEQRTVDVVQGRPA